MTHRLVLISRWRLESSTAAVWNLLSKVETWPTWWRQVSRVEPGAANLLDFVAELHWWSALPYGAGVRFAIDSSAAPRRLEFHALGGLPGFGAWLLEPAEDGWIDVTYRWEALLERRWMRALSVLLRPLCEWHHFKLMRATADGMGRELDCRAQHLNEWSGTRWL
ncbi:hypothetical protein BH11PSE10_BH11PSE10_11940 [soil metagenome]